MSDSSHELNDFMLSISKNISDEYQRIRRRVKEDPGTAGDEGEETWKELFEQWLPPAYHIVTKGRILSLTGSASGQIDLLVLHPAYPKFLRNKKVYLAGGVAAAFECKLTLKAAHVKRAIQNAASIRRLLTERQGTPYKELHSPLIYGLLAHSHDWQRPESSPKKNITDLLYKGFSTDTRHPHDMVDVVCVADLATWYATRFSYLPIDANRPGYRGPICTSYTQTITEWQSSKPHMGALIFSLLNRLAWEDTSLRRLADYFWQALQSWGHGTIETWPLNVYSPEVQAQITAQAGAALATPLDKRDRWNEWFWPGQ